jgi:hypothetical protein
VGTLTLATRGERGAGEVLVTVQGKAIFDALRGDVMVYGDEESLESRAPLIHSSKTSYGR